MTERLGNPKHLFATLVAVALLALPVTAWATDVRMINYATCTYGLTTADLWVDGLENRDTVSSGPLRLELWVSAAPYTTGAGTRASVFSLPGLNAGAKTGPTWGVMPFARPPNGAWYFTMVLTEYTGASSANDGYEIRYWISFSGPEFVGVAPPPKKVKAVEFYHPGLDHYFITASQKEIDDLNGAAQTGWWSTGYTFNVWDTPNGATQPVCRYYIPPELGDSHFFSASQSECAKIPEMFPSYVLESHAAFDVTLPDPNTGACATGEAPVYRLWNGRADSGHRYTTSTDVKAQMIAAGYVAEGFGPDGVAMCSPQ